MREPIHVECYSGHTYAQEPRMIVWHGFRVPVVKIQRAWRTPIGPAFRVSLETGIVVDLFFDESNNRWLISSRAS